MSLDGSDGADGDRIKFGFTASELSWVDPLIGKDDVHRALASLEDWDFNVFELDKACNQNALLIVSLGLVKRLELDKQLPIDVDNLARLLTKLQAGYKEVPFHNKVHAADVTHGTAYFMNQNAVFKHMSAVDLYCMILGAAVHDFEHPGFNNAFLVAQRHEIAILYNDSSVLENFHIASAWRLMLQDSLNPFAGFSNEQFAEARATMVHSILGTDMKFHFDHLTKFKTRMNAGAFELDELDRKDVRLLIAMCMHSADVSNPAKRWDLSAEWSCRVMEEFFRQGEREAELGMPVSAFMDRQKTDIAKCQHGFISILIKPFFDEWCSFLGNEHRQIFVNVEDNIKIWAERGEEALGERSQQLHQKLPLGAPPTDLDKLGAPAPSSVSKDKDRKLVSFKG